MKAFIVVTLFIIGSLFFNAGYGADGKKQKRAYYITALVILIVLFLIVNFLP